VFLNRFADGVDAVDLTGTEEFASLLQSADELGVTHADTVRYVSRNTVVRGQRFHFSEWGVPGRPQLLLLHGGNQSAHSWDLVSLHLADRFHVFALDQRGHGDSEWSRELDYSLDAMVADAEAFVAAVGLDRPVVLGHSMGGRVTLTLALRRPDLARALVVVDVGPEVSEAGARTILDFVARNLEFDDLDQFVDNVVRYDPFRSRVHITRTLRYNLLQRADGRWISKVDHRRIPHPNRALTLDDVRAIEVPVLVVRGAESNILEADAAVRFADALPSGRLVTVDRTGHNVHSGNTTGFLAAVAPFLEAVTGD